MNVSQGGLRVHLKQPLPSDGPVQISFTLPGTKHVLNLNGEVAWQNNQGHAGIRFISQQEQTKRDLQLWLEQRYLTN